MTRYDFEMLVNDLSRKQYHIWYSLNEGWCYISYKQYRDKIDITMSHEQVNKVLFYCKPLKYQQWTT